MTTPTITIAWAAPILVVAFPWPPGTVLTDERGLYPMECESPQQTPWIARYCEADEGELARTIAMMHVGDWQRVGVYVEDGEGWHRLVFKAGAGLPAGGREVGPP